MWALPRERPNGDMRSMIAAENVSAIHLAAGGSRRFGTSDKLLAPVAGAPLALHAAARIMELAPGRRIAVSPDGAGPLARRLAAEGCDIAVIADEALGISCRWEARRVGKKRVSRYSTRWTPDRKT